jgi:hypothetical protein
MSPFCFRTGTKKNRTVCAWDRKAGTLLRHVTQRRNVPVLLSDGNEEEQDRLRLGSQSGDTAATCDSLFEGVRTQPRNVPVLLSDGKKNRTVCDMRRNAAMSPFCFRTGTKKNRTVCAWDAN